MLLQPHMLGQVEFFALCLSGCYLILTVALRERRIMQDECQRFDILSVGKVESLEQRVVLWGGLAVLILIQEDR